MKAVVNSFAAITVVLVSTAEATPAVNEQINKLQLHMVKRVI